MSVKSNYQQISNGEVLDDADSDDEEVESIECGKPLEIKPATAYLPPNIMEEVAMWARDQWTLQGLPIKRMIPNPALQIAGGLSSKFFTAIQEELISLSEGSYVLAWHGTFEHNICAICMNGFDPTLRQGQQYGVGEYFGTNCGISHGYCKGGYFMIVVMLLRGDWLREQPGTSYIVNNPISLTKTYSLPLMVILSNDINLIVQIPLLSPITKVVNFGSDRPSPFDA
jgi:hypothetical protein